MEKIFNGIKKSVMFLAFVSQKYIDSEYCMREIRLANILKKPIIPLACEKFDTWPPEQIIMQVLDIIYLPLYQNNNQWSESLLLHLCQRLPSLDIPLSKEMERRNSFCVTPSGSPTRTEHVLNKDDDNRRSGSQVFTDDLFLVDKTKDDKDRFLTVSNKSKSYERTISFHGDMLDDPFG
jgi:hypothetical protein